MNISFESHSKQFINLTSPVSQWVAPTWGLYFKIFTIVIYDRNAMASAMKLRS